MMPAAKLGPAELLYSAEPGIQDSKNDNNGLDKDIGEPEEDPAVGDLMNGINITLNTGGSGQPKKNTDDQDAKNMLHDIIEHAYEPRQWLHFIGRNDYKIADGAAIFKEGGHRNVGSLLHAVFHKINDTPQQKYVQSIILYDNIYVKLNSAAASPHISCPNIFKSYGDLSSIFDEKSNMSFPELAKRVKPLCKGIAQGVKYLFLTREDTRCFITEPELDWSFVVLLVITVLSQPELFAYLQELGFTKEKHSRIYEDQVSDLLKYLRHNSKRGKYKGWSTTRITRGWERLQEKLQAEYRGAEGTFAEGYEEFRPGDEGEGSTQPPEVLVDVTSKIGTKRKSGEHEVELEKPEEKKKKAKKAKQSARD